MAYEPDDDERILVCVTEAIPSKFSDDQFGNCSECNVRIRFRPHLAHIEKKICMDCLVKNNPDPSDLEIEVTQETKEEVLQILKKERLH